MTEREKDREGKRERDQGRCGKNTFMERNTSHNLHLAPQEKNSDFQEAVSHLIVSEKEMKLEKDK